jgi:hypothetical protein
MQKLRIMFDNGENSKVSLEWELFDTPPVKIWKELIEYTVARNTENFNITDAVFCNSKEEAVQYWNIISSKLIELGILNNCIEFEELNPEKGNFFISELFNLHSTCNDFEVINQIIELIDELKSLLYYLNGNKEGYISSRLDPYFVEPFDLEWSRYFTLDITPGTLYFEIIFNISNWAYLLTQSWTDIQYWIKIPDYGKPLKMGAGFIIPFGEDMGKYKNQLPEFLNCHSDYFKTLNPNFSVDTAMQYAGRIPVGKLITPIGISGYYNYDNLKKITKVFKIEFTEE